MLFSIKNLNYSLKKIIIKYSATKHLPPTHTGKIELPFSEIQSVTKQSITQIVHQNTNLK